MVAATSVSLLAPTVHATAGFVQWDIIKRSQPKLGLRKRAGTQQEIIDNSQARGGYFATCTLGTPGQHVTLQLDTGSSDIWVPSSSASVCDDNACSLGSCTYHDPLPRPLPPLGTLRHFKLILAHYTAVTSGSSSTFQDIDEVFEISYVDGSFSKGDYFTDSFTIANTSVSNLTMGLGSDTTIPYGLLGIGYALNEAIIDTKESLGAAYHNLPALMMNEGIIATNAYSLWLNDLDASTGSILFGGIDTEKYVGDLTRIPVIKNNVSDQFDSFIVELTSIDAVSSSGIDRLTSHQDPIKVVLDSGTTLSYLPTDLAEQVWEETGAIYSASTGLALIPCRMQRSTGYFNFTLGGVSGPTVKIGMDELVLDLVVSGPAPTFTSGQYAGEDACEFGIQNTTGTNLLGDTFLRSAYVVYDLMNNEIGIAQTDFNATDSNIVAFANQSAVIPSATLAPNVSAATATATFTEPGFLAEVGFSNGTSGAVARGPQTVFGLSTVVLAMAVMGGVVVII